MLDAVIKLADELGVIETIKGALLQDPDQASEKLAEVLDELGKTVSALDDEMIRYLSLYFPSGESVAQGRAVLLGMEVGQSMIRINEARGHCHKIKNIYETYLDKWFDRLTGIAPEDEVTLRKSFTALGTADDTMIQAMKEVSCWLKGHAESTLDQLDTGNFDGANIEIKQARTEAKPAREKLIGLMCDLRILQADLIEKSGTV